MKNYLFLLCCAFAVFFSGCDYGVPTASNHEMWNGYITLVDSLGNQPADKSGATVVLDGTTLTAQTGIDGHYSFENPPTDKNYDVIISKPGYGTTKVLGQYYLTGSVIPTATLSEPPNFYFHLDSTAAIGSQISMFYSIHNTNSAAAGRGLYGVVLFGKDSNVTGSDISHYSYAFEEPADPNAPIKKLAWTSNQLVTEGGFNRGDKLYAVFYGLNYDQRNYSSNYQETPPGLNYYTALSKPSNRVSFIVP